MDKGQVKQLRDAVESLNYYSELLMASLESNTHPTADFETLTEWHEHLSNMVGHYLAATVDAYAHVDGWNTPRLTWEQ
jgi:hypothetical protein